MTSQTFTAEGTVDVGLRIITFNNLNQAVAAGLAAAAGGAVLNLIRIASTTGEVETADDADLTAAWEGSAVAITLTLGEHSATVFGPNHPGSFRDDSAPYLWLHRSSAAVIALVIAAGAGTHTFTITLDDGVAGLSDAIAPAVSIDAVAAGREGTTVVLGATVTGGTYDDLDYAWTVDEGSLDDATAAAPTWTRPSVSAAKNVGINLRITARGTGTDARSGTSATADAAEIDARVTDTPVQLPVAAAPAVSIDPVAAGREGTQVALSAAVTGGTYDDLDYAWTVDEGTLDDASAAAPTWTRPSVSAAKDVGINLRVTARGTGTVARSGTSATADAAEVDARVTDTPPPLAAPTLSGTAGDGRVEVSWTEVPGATSYERRHKRSSSQNWGAWAAAESDRTQTFGGLVNGVSYDFQVRGKTSSQNGPPSNTLTLTPAAAPAPRFAAEADAGAIVDLFKVTLEDGSVERYTTGPVDGASVRYGGQTFAPLPITLDGARFVSSGAAGRPTLRVSNLGTATEPRDWHGATIERTRTLARYLDGAAEADSDRHFAVESWVVDRLSSQRRDEVVWQLSSPLDLEIAMIPGRQVLRDVCGWAYRRRVNGAWVNPPAETGCPYRGTRPDGGPFWNAEDEPTNDPAKDKCSLRLSGCQLRFGEHGELPFGGFAGVARYRR